MRMVWESWNAEIEHRCLAKRDDEVDTEDGPGMLSLESESPEVVFTPVGIYYEESPKRPSKMWSCFTCHTDFDIANTKFSKIMDEIEGVESYKALGKYTFFVGFGKLFDQENVRNKINEEAKKYVQA